MLMERRCGWQTTATEYSQSTPCAFYLENTCNLMRRTLEFLIEMPISRILPLATSLSANSRPPTPSKPAKINDYLGLSHPPHVTKPSIVTPLSIQVGNGPDGAVPGFFHLHPTSSPTPFSDTAAILLSGAEGGVVGPSSIYLSLADKLASLKRSVPVLRLDLSISSAKQALCKGCVSSYEPTREAVRCRQVCSRWVVIRWSASVYSRWAR